MGFGDDYQFGDKKLAVVLVIDISGSMVDHIERLNKTFNDFIEYSKSKDEFNSMMDIAVVTFNSEANKVFDFVPVSMAPALDLEAGGTTNMAAALELAVQMVHDRKKDYMKIGASIFKPWIITMSDGRPDSIEDVKRIGDIMLEKECEGKFHSFAVGMGPAIEKDDQYGYDPKVLTLFASKQLAINNWDFATFFSWLGKSMAKVSESKPGDEGIIADTGEEGQLMYKDFLEAMKGTM